MVENFHKRIRKNILTKYQFQSTFDMNGKLIGFVNDYNMNKKPKSLNYKTLSQYLQDAKGIDLNLVKLEN